MRGAESTKKGGETMYRCSICDQAIKTGQVVDVIMRHVGVINGETGQTITNAHSHLEFEHHDCAAAERGHGAPPARTEGT